MVPCGGGNLLAAVAAAIKMSLHNVRDCRIYGIEPDGGKSMITVFHTCIDSVVRVNNDIT